MVFNPAKVFVVTRGMVLSLQTWRSYTDAVFKGPAGLGSGCIKILAHHNPSQIFFTGRNEAKADDLIQQIKKTNPNVSLTFVECDLTSFASVHTAAESITASTCRLDVLICNAGIMAANAGTTEDGYEIQFQVNHLSYPFLVKNLLPLLVQTTEQPNADVRVANMASISYQQAPKIGIDFASLKSSHSHLRPLIPGLKWTRYGQSKLANMLYPSQLAKHYPKILTVAIHPGIIVTDLFANVSFGTRLPALILSIGKRTPLEQGPYNMLWAATSPKAGIKNGEYYEPVGIVGKRTTNQARDSKLAETL